MARAQEGFEKTNQSLAEMVSAMDGINASSQKISKIIKVIDEIAFQTNILALNAAVEAARAGEAGMGFAVVADEVRNLAQRCAQAAKDTADLIEESIQRSDGGRVKVDQVAVAIRAITAESAKIKMLVDEINLGSVEQSSGIDQISRAITQMEQVTQSSAANAEESAAAAEELNAQAEHMKDVVGALRAMVDGAARAGRSSVAIVDWPNALGSIRHRPHRSRRQSRSSPSRSAEVQSGRRSAMAQLSRTGVSLEDDLLKEFDRLIAKRGYAEPFRGIPRLIREALLSESVESNKPVVGTLTLVYDHHVPNLAQKLTEVQHGPEPWCWRPPMSTWTIITAWK